MPLSVMSKQYTYTGLFQEMLEQILNPLDSVQIEFGVPTTT